MTNTPDLASIKRRAEALTSSDSRLIEELRHLRGPDHTAACGVAAVRLIERLLKEIEVLRSYQDDAAALSAAEAKVADCKERLYQMTTDRDEQVAARLRAEARAEKMRAALQSLHWHYTNNTINREIMLGIVEEQLGFRAALAADTDAGEGKSPTPPLVREKEETE